MVTKKVIQGILGQASDKDDESNINVEGKKKFSIFGYDKTGKRGPKSKIKTSDGKGINLKGKIIISN